MSEPFIGEIKIFAGNFAPRSYAFCNGQLLPIAQNTALFSLFGTIYGGDGRTTFGLPNLQGRIPVHAGQGPALTRRHLGERGGVKTVTLTSDQMPRHSHRIDLARLLATSNVANTSDPSGNRLAAAEIYSYDWASSELHADSLSDEVEPAGGGQPHTNMPPYLAVNFIVALQGIYPSRN